MRIGVPQEVTEGETRVALTPSAAGSLVQAGFEVCVERGAGRAAGFVDEEYADADVDLSDAAATLGADIVLKVRPPLMQGEGAREEISRLREGGVLVGLLEPFGSPARLQALASRGLTSFAIERMPRITRAQRMDALSAMSTVSGYKAAVLAADSLGKFFPMLMTAAGTMSPARVFVLGAGVAGLQAIATSRRLGAVVEAFDIRPAVKEQVESLGATFVEWEAEEAGESGELETEGGYAVELSEEHQARERRMIGRHVARADVVITTALVPGSAAPVLVTADMAARMRPGSVIVDLAAENGGNCELTRAGETVEQDGVLVHGPLNLPATLPYHASQMLSKNFSAFVRHLAPEGEVVIDLDDEITGDCCVTHEGKVRFEP